MGGKGLHSDWTRKQFHPPRRKCPRNLLRASTLRRHRGPKSGASRRVAQHKRLIKLDMWLMSHYPCNYTKTYTQRTTPRRSGHDQMEAQAMHALQRHPARQMATMRHRQVRRCVIAAEPHDLYSLTRGFAALHARQPAPERAGKSFGGSHELRAQV